jgi:phosphoglycerate dehydrogenase-like enzyme
VPGIVTPVLGLVEELPDDQLAVLRDSIPAGWAVGDVDGADALLVRDGTVDAGVLERAPNVRRIVRIELGSGSVDDEACAARGIPVSAVPSPSLYSVAEHAVMSMLVLLKRYPRVSAELRSGVVAGGAEPRVTTQESYAFNWTGLERWEALYGKTVGLIGIGQIGRHVARILGAFGAQVLYTKPNRLPAEDEERLGVAYAPFDELLARSHVVSLHNRFVPETERMMDDRAFGLMREGSFFVNTARGRLVDEAALLRALDSGNLAGAALDVFWLEPLPADSPLLQAPNLVLTPHTGGIPIAESRILELGDAARSLAAEP